MGFWVFTALLPKSQVLCVVTLCHWCAAPDVAKDCGIFIVRVRQSKENSYGLLLLTVKAMWSCSWAMSSWRQSHYSPSVLGLFYPEGEGTAVLWSIATALGLLYSEDDSTMLHQNLATLLGLPDPTGLCMWHIPVIYSFVILTNWLDKIVIYHELGRWGRNWELSARRC